LVSLEIFFIANFHVLGLFIPKKQVSKFRLSRGGAVRALVEICIDDISPVLKATDFD
jgi:hypothetical protein